MPVSKSAKKALRQAKKRTALNRRYKKAIKQAIRAFRRVPNLKNLSKLYSLIDKAAKRHIFHKNKAARLKRRFAKLLQPKPKKGKADEKRR